MTVTKRPSPHAPKKADHYKDNARFKQCADERLSENAGYARAESTPNSKQ